MAEMNPPLCAKCGRGMERGMVLDRGHYNMAAGASIWMEGKQLPGFWGGMNDKGKRQFVVITFRCGGCGYVESYAPPRLFSPAPRD